MLKCKGREVVIVVVAICVVALVAIFLVEGHFWVLLNKLVILIGEVVKVVPVLIEEEHLCIVTDWGLLHCHRSEVRIKVLQVCHTF